MSGYVNKLGFQLPGADDNPLLGGTTTLADAWRENKRVQAEASVPAAPGPNPLVPPPPWWGNPVGTERVNEQSVGVPRGDFDPVVDKWPTGKPRTLSEYRGIEETSQNLYDQLSMALPTGGGGGRVALASVRRGTTRGPRTTPLPREPGPAAERSPEPVPTSELATAPERAPAAAPPSPPASPTATVADIGGGTRGMMAVPSLRSMTPAEAATAAASEPHIIEKPGGGYVGFPEHVRTPADIQAMRADLDRAIDAGAHQRDWYQINRDWIGEITGSRYDPKTGELLVGQPGEARRVAEGLGTFSPQSNPDTNRQFYLQARNAWERGLPLDIARTGQQARTYNTAMAETEEMRAGKKTEPFAWHLSADRPYGTTGVNDIWHARSMGYRNPNGTPFSGSPSEQMHMVMDYETVLAINRANQRAAGGFTDWNAATVQAAPWVANKEASLRARYPKWTEEQIREEARKGFSESAPVSTAYMTHEQAPGASTGLYVAPNALGQWSQAATWRDQTGRDLLTGNLFHQSPMRETLGTYRNSRGELETNPAHSANPLIDFSANVEPRQIHPGTQSALTGASAVRALTDVQEIQPWHYIDTRGGRPIGERTSMRLTGARPTGEQMVQLQTLADKHGYFVADTGDGVSLIHNADSKASPAHGIELRDRLRGGLQGELEAALPGSTVTTGRHSGDFVDLTSELAESVKGQGKATTKVLGLLEDMRTGAPAMYEKMLDNPGVAAKAQANLDRLTPEMQAKRSDYVDMLKIMAAGNLRGLLEYVAKAGSAAGLPAALLALSQRDDR